MSAEAQITEATKSPLDEINRTKTADTDTFEKGEIVEDATQNSAWAQYGQTKRGLSPRHVQLMAIGGSIGTGLFVGIGGSLIRAGPLSLVLGYLFYGFMFIWPCYLYVAEICAYLPVRGTIYELASRFVDPALGFAMGWTYFYGGVMLVCTEYSAVAAVMEFWNVGVNPAVWIAMCLVVCTFLNIVAVRWYGETEFVFASTKLLLLIGLILLTFITMVGGNPRNDAYGFRYWKHGNAMHPYYTTGNTGRFLGWWSVVRYAAFTTSGPDMLAVSSGEIQNPRHTIPRVAKLIFYRLVGFYVIGVLCVGIICSSRDAGLINAIENGASGAAASPWVIGIQNLSISGLPGLINVLILLSGWSCGNAYLYATSRTLYSMARDHHAPKIFAKCTKGGVPIYAVLTISLLSCLTFLVASNAAIQVFYWFVNLTTIAYLLVYCGMLWTFLGWYNATKAQGLDRRALPYRAPLAPYGAYLALTIGALIIFFIGYDSIVPWSTQGFITSYFGGAYTLVAFLLWKFGKGTKFTKSSEADLYSGKSDIDRECRHWEEGGLEEARRARLANMNIFRRTWERMW